MKCHLLLFTSLSLRKRRLSERVEKKGVIEIERVTDEKLKRDEGRRRMRRGGGRGRLEQQES